MIGFDEKAAKTSKKDKLIKKVFLFPKVFAKSSTQESGTRKDENDQTKNLSFKQKCIDLNSLEKKYKNLIMQNRNQRMKLLVKNYQKLLRNPTLRLTVLTTLMQL